MVTGEHGMRNSSAEKPGAETLLFRWETHVLRSAAEGRADVNRPAGNLPC